MKNLERERNTQCHAIIHTASASAAVVGAGLAQIPCSDTAVLTPIQLTMTIALARVYGLELTEAAAKASLAATTAATVGRTASQVLIGWLPGVGNVVNACTAATVTETVGWMLVKDFARQAGVA